MASRFSVDGIAEGVWHHASAWMELPKAYGITEGAYFLRLDSIPSATASIQPVGLIPYRNKLRITSTPLA